MLQKFKHGLKREILIYIFMLLVLAVVMHVDLLTDPSTRFEIMHEKENYSHPFLYTFVIYIIIFIIRKAIDLIAVLFQKKSK